MKKHSRFFTRHDYKVKELLGELALRDMQSEQTKINQLINKQKATFHIYRSLKTPTSKPDHFKKLKLEKSTSSPNFEHEKENFINEKNRVESNKTGTAHNQKRKLQKMSTTRYKRYFLNTSSYKDEAQKASTVALPELHTLTKRSSLEKILENKQKVGISIQPTELAIIQQANEHPQKCKKSPINTLSSVKFKQRSLATLKK